jgi:hypothetical protein
LTGTPAGEGRGASPPAGRYCIKPAAPVRRRHIADISHWRPAGARRWWHAPAHQDKLTIVAGVAHDRRGIIWKYARHRRQVADVAVHDAEEGGDRALIGGNRIEVTHRQFRSWTCPASHSRVRPGFLRDARMARKSWLFAHSVSSPDSWCAKVEVQTAESLRPFPQISPFCGDYRRRLVRSALPPERPIRTTVKFRKLRYYGAAISTEQDSRSSARSRAGGHRRLFGNGFVQID